MHKINVLTIGSDNFNTSLEELKDYLNFNLTTFDTNSEMKSFEEYDVLLCHQDFFKNHSSFEQLKKTDKVKILACNYQEKRFDFFNDKILLPTKFQEINNIIENSLIKKSFSLNSSIKIKKYILDKNEKKLKKDNKYIVLTEKEIRLLEVLLEKNRAISKDSILSLVWNYSSESDTHTVETHIYRLRKKIKDKFSDDKFILNNKKGYFI